MKALRSSPRPVRAKDTALAGVHRLARAVAGWPATVLIALVRFYRLMLSPWLGSQCRFEPTCSRYALEALQRHGAGGGSYLAARRILRCHPWCRGGLDPVPPDHPIRRTGSASPSSSHSPSTSSPTTES